MIMVDDFSKNIIKEYKYWTLYVESHQSYLGQCIVYCKRDEALDLADATMTEQQELFLILQKLREAAKIIFQPDWFNYTFLGNDLHHLHCHFIPRYARSRIFMSQIFEDRLFGHNYKMNRMVVTPPELLAGLRDEYKKAL